MLDLHSPQQVRGNDRISGGSDSHAQLRSYDWSATALGPIATWPPALRSAVSLCFESRFPTVIHWGFPNPTVLYNDAFARLVDAHPSAFGRSLSETWPELRPAIEAVLERVIGTGSAAVLEDVLHVRGRDGCPEETYLKMHFNPIVLECGRIGGSLALIEDVTERVVDQRRQQTLRDLAARSSDVTQIEDACRIAGDVLAENRHDLPFALIYVADNVLDEDRKHARLATAVRVSPEEAACLPVVDLAASETTTAWPVARAAYTSSSWQAGDMQQKLGARSCALPNSPSQCALLLPITPANHQLPAGVLVAGLGTGACPTEAQQDFLRAIASQIAATIGRALRYERLATRQIVDAIPHMIAVVAPSGMVLYSNHTAREYAGLTAEQATLQGFRARGIHPDDADSFEEERRKSLLGVVPFKNERQRIRRKDGQFRWFLIEYNPLRDARGQVTHWYAAATDIDDRVRAEQSARSGKLALRDQSERDATFDGIVGCSDALRRVLHQVGKVARSSSTVLVLGETGTGKELVARAIHRRSARAAGAFVAVNCAAIPSSLIASELFGHEKGGFTGATHRRLGRFESANGGTIFLDEVGDVPHEIQVALLRVLQEREIERVGSDRPIPVDVRVVAATHRDLDALVAQGQFRQDLLYRLKVVPIAMPPLRERATDIPALVEHFVSRIAKNAGKEIKAIDRRTLELFQAYDWPGNVRELENVVERAVILSDGDTLSVDEAWLEQRARPAPTAAATLGDALSRQEQQMIEAALAESRGIVAGPAGAAVKLGLPTQTLDSKIKRLGIDKYRFRI